MRRAVIAVLGTAAGTALLVGLRSGLAAGHGTHAAATAPPAAPAGSSSSTPVPPPGRSTTPAGGTTPGGGATPAPGGPGPTVAKPGPHAGTFTGTVVQTKYGPVRVRITVAGGRITDVAAPQLPSSHGESVRINQRAAPILRQEALDAQNAEIDTVSGATYTSRGYRTSLQAALDAATHG